MTRMPWDLTTGELVWTVVLTTLAVAVVAAAVLVPLAIREARVQRRLRDNGEWGR